MKNLRVQIVSEVCEWFALNPLELIDQPFVRLSTFDAKNGVKLKKEQKAWALIMHSLTSDKIAEHKMNDQQIADYFGVKLDDVMVGKTYHEFLTYRRESYTIICKKIAEFINKKTLEFYECA